MFTLYIGYDCKSKQQTIQKELKLNDGESMEVVVPLLYGGFNVEIWSSGCPLAFYEDEFIRTDQDGFAGFSNTLDSI
ncbi:MAG: hypothetical protein WC688_07360 [Parachlamydiales bacterium]|jgi:hypothetical protein